MDKDRIEASDIVSIDFLRRGSVFEALVLHTPVATGDSWRVRTIDGQLLYVQTFESMTLEAKGVA